MMIRDLNENDKKAYVFIRNRIIHGSKAPTLREIAKEIGKSSSRSAVLALDRLEAAGLIVREKGKIGLTSFSLEQNASITTVEVPLVGSVAAGYPILAEENVEAMISVSTALARKGGTYFLLRVTGNSMNEAGINDGDVILVRQQSTADDGEKIVALINDEATVKILERKRGLVILRPKSSDPSFKSIVLTEDCAIQGVVVGVLPPDIY